MSFTAISDGSGRKVIFPSASVISCVVLYEIVSFVRETGQETVTLKSATAPFSSVTETTYGSLKAAFEYTVRFVLGADTTLSSIEARCSLNFFSA